MLLKRAPRWVAVKRWVASMVEELEMVHGYHVIFGTYGFWLPNDPRGSWSEFVGKWELIQFGRATRSVDRRELTEQEQKDRKAAKAALKYPPVRLSGIQARAVGRGFGNCVRKSRLTIWACSILPEHVHLVIARHNYDVEQLTNLMKGEATKQLRKEGLHPLLEFAEGDQRPPTPWADRKWKVFLDSSASIEDAIQYVEQNPAEAGLPTQHWSFVTPFEGLDRWVTYRST